MKDTAIAASWGPRRRHDAEEKTKIYWWAAQVCSFMGGTFNCYISLWDSESQYFLKPAGPVGLRQGQHNSFSGTWRGMNLWLLSNSGHTKIAQRRKGREGAENMQETERKSLQF